MICLAFTDIVCQFPDQLAAGGEGIGQVCFWGTGKMHVLLVHGAHDIGAGGIHLASGQAAAVKMAQEKELKLYLVNSVGREFFGEVFVVGEGEGIHGIVHQFAQGVKIPHSENTLALQPNGQASDKTAGIIIVVPPQPVAAYGALDIGGGIPVRLDAPNQKETRSGPGYAGHILPQQKPAEYSMTFPAHGITPI